MSDDDIGYFQQRADEERGRAAAASQPAIADIHLALAAKYEALARQGRAPSPFIGGMGTMRA